MTDESILSKTDIFILRSSLASVWWLFLLRGLAAVAFGILALLWPGVALWTLVLLFGAYVLVDGIVALLSGIVGIGGIRLRWWLVMIGLIGVAAGIATFVWPQITAIILLYLIAGWAVASGVFQVIGGIRLRRDIENEWLLILSGTVSVIFGVVLFLMPSAGALAVVWIVAIYAILHGIALLSFALVLRKHAG